MPHKLRRINSSELLEDDDDVYTLCMMKEPTPYEDEDFAEQKMIRYHADGVFLTDEYREARAKRLAEQEEQLALQRYLSCDIEDTHEEGSCCSSSDISYESESEMYLRSLAINEEELPSDHPAAPTTSGFPVCFAEPLQEEESAEQLRHRGEHLAERKLVMEHERQKKVVQLAELLTAMSGCRLCSYLYLDELHEGAIRALYAQHVSQNHEESIAATEDAVSQRGHNTTDQVLLADQKGIWRVGHELHRRRREDDGSPIFELLDIPHDVWASSILLFMTPIDVVKISYASSRLGFICEELGAWDTIWDDLRIVTYLKTPTPFSCRPVALIGVTPNCAKNIAGANRRPKDFAKFLTYGADLAHGGVESYLKSTHSYKFPWSMFLSFRYELAKLQHLAWRLKRNPEKAEIHLRHVEINGWRALHNTTTNPTAKRFASIMANHCAGMGNIAALYWEVLEHAEQPMSERIKLLLGVAKEGALTTLCSEVRLSSMDSTPAAEICVTSGLSMPDLIAHLLETYSSEDSTTTPQWLAQIKQDYENAVPRRVTQRLVDVTGTDEVGGTLGFKIRLQRDVVNGNHTKVKVDPTRNSSSTVIHGNASPPPAPPPKRRHVQQRAKKKRLTKQMDNVDAENRQLQHLSPYERLKVRLRQEAALKRSRHSYWR